MHKGTDNQTFNPINVAKQQNELNKSGGAASETLLLLLLSCGHDAQLGRNKVTITFNGVTEICLSANLL